MRTLIVSKTTPFYQWLLIAYASLFFWGASSIAFALDSDPILAPCNHCQTEQHFANAAKQAVPEPPPGDAQYREFGVYALNMVDVEVRFFSVGVWRDEGGILPMAGTFQSGVHKVATPADGDPDVLTDIFDAIAFAIAAKAHFSAGLTSTDINAPIDSAISLIGPDDSAAGYNRLILANAINDHFNSLTATMTIGLTDLAVRIGVRFLGDSSFITYMGNLKVEFEDGTSIEIDINGVRDGNPVRLELEVRPETARLPDGSPVPQSPGHFSGLEWDDSIGGGTNIAQQLYWLAQQLGFGDGMDCDFSCEPGTNSCSLICRP